MIVCFLGMFVIIIKTIIFRALQPSAEISSVKRPDFCDFARMFVIYCTFGELLSCKISCPKLQKDDKIITLVLPGFMPIFLLKICPDSARIFTKIRPDGELATLARESVKQSVH